ncbi:hypothetical protein [Microtetraspora fusca]|uniref:hypothetical protein n=1 Tax=Microtetraspora fusca TaxID=1997 RepID=UPI0012FB43FB|nr:hypothetical protein [Microtetraspora fusca]
MTWDGADQRNGGKLAALGIVWFAGTPFLAMVAFWFGFSLAGAEPVNAQLAVVFAFAAAILGLGAPVVGLLFSLTSRNKIGAWIYGLITAAIGVLLYTQVVAPMMARYPAYVEDPPVCTAPPDRAAGVPGC